MVSSVLAPVMELSCLVVLWSAYSSIFIGAIFDHNDPATSDGGECFHGTFDQGPEGIYLYDSPCNVSRGVICEMKKENRFMPPQK